MDTGASRPEVSGNKENLWPLASRQVGLWETRPAHESQDARRHHDDERSGKGKFYTSWRGTYNLPKIFLIFRHDNKEMEWRPVPDFSHKLAR